VALSLHVLTGGQRIEQIVRLEWADLSDDALTIFDDKGRPRKGPRAHQIPLVKLARSDLALLKREGELAISTTAGKKARAACGRWPTGLKTCSVTRSRASS
jgi:integrase